MDVNTAQVMTPISVLLLNLLISANNVTFAYQCKVDPCDALYQNVFVSGGKVLSIVP